MKQKIKKILLNPKIATSIALGVAIIIGIISYIVHTNTLESRFAKINTISSANESSLTTPSKNLTLAFATGGKIKKVSVKIGDKVKAGTILASLDAENVLGAMNQARAAYISAQNAYDKLVNGTSTPDIDIAKVALKNAKNTYDTTIAQQKVLVSNAFSSMLNAGLSPIPTISGLSNVNSPIISGSYESTEKGTYTINIYPSGDGANFSYSGLENGSGKVSTTATPLGTRGLFIQFPNNNISSAGNTSWTISVPNTQSPSYLTYYNLYQSALQNQSQAIASAQNTVNSAQANLDQKLASARSEDLAIAKAQVESTQGALQIAQGAYNNTIITASVDGTITNVTITAGQIATANTLAIELLSQ